MEKNELKILNYIAQGGQKTVSLAVSINNPSLKVVVKDAKINSTSSLQRMIREVNLLKQLDSPYFPKNYGSSFDVFTMTMTIIEEYIEGDTLRFKMDNYQDWNSIKSWLNSMIGGLQIVWNMNIVHRDLKPENIIIKTDGSPCIIDFGIARFLDLESITNTLNLRGPNTPLYASPEQLKNEKHIIDMRTDFYALGIILLEMYLGVHPFTPSIVPNSGLTILDNIQAGRYTVCTPNKVEDPKITKLATRLLQYQPYLRPRNFEQLRNLINTL